MTVQAQEIFNESVANGVTTVFPYTFKILASQDLIVQADGVVVPPSTYSVSGMGNAVGGNITFNTAPASGVKILRKRELPLQRLVDYQDNGDLLAKTLNGDIDKVWMVLQQFARDLLRSIKLPFTTQDSQLINDAIAIRKNKALVFDVDGNIALSTHTIQQIEAPSQSADDAIAAAQAAASSAGSASTASSQATTAKNDAVTAKNAAESAAAFAAALPGRLVDDQYFATSGTWTKPAGLPATAYAIVEIQGGGGGGGGAWGATGTQMAAGSAGGGGSYVKLKIPLSDLPATASVVVGSGGIPGGRIRGVVATGGLEVDQSPSQGGSSSFNGMTVYGGSPGINNAISAGTTATNEVIGGYGGSYDSVAESTGYVLTKSGGAAGSLLKRMTGPISTIRSLGGMAGAAFMVRSPQAPLIMTDSWQRYTATGDITDMPWLNYEYGKHGAGGDGAVSTVNDPALANPATGLSQRLGWRGARGFVRVSVYS